MLLRRYYPSAMAYKSKIRRVGNSLGILLPKELLEDLRVQEGDELSFDKASGTYQVKPIDPHFEKLMAAYREVANEYRNTFRELAK
jgi:putative addiction module antidote